MDKDFEWGYREANQGDVGSQIEVGADDTGWVSLECLAVLPAEMPSRFVCRSRHNPKIPVYYGQSRVRYRLSYAERQAKCGIGVGDFVKVLRVPGNHEDDWGVNADPAMSDSVGKVFEVSKVLPKTGFFLKNNWWYPYFVLERAEKPVLEESKPKGRTVADLADGEVICTDDGEWIQVIARTGRGTLCDRQSALDNRHDVGWVELGACGPGNRPARLLHAPTMESPAIGKTVFHVTEPSERFKVQLVFSDGVESRAVIHCDLLYRVARLSDLRVIPE